MSKELRFILDGVETKRYHTWPTLRTQNVGEHSCRVALIAAWIAGDQEPGISAPLLMAALCHDLAEHQMGDLPAPVKRGLPDYPGYDDAGGFNESRSFREVWDAQEQTLLAEVGLNWEHMLNDTEKRWLKIADAADGCFYCIRERAMGNKLIDPVYINFTAYLSQLVIDGGFQPREQELYAYTKKEWKNAKA